jgi:hypothetical protein
MTALCVVVLMVMCAIGVQAADDVRTMHVSGEATVMARPDNVRVQVGVQTIESELQAAQNNNAQTFEKVLGAIRALDYENMTMKTVGFDVSTITEDKSSRDLQPPKIIGYRVENHVSIRMSDAEPKVLSERAAKVIDAAVSNGANQVGSIEIFIMDEAQYREEAMLKAAADARQKADKLAEALDTNISGYQSISAQDVGYVPYRREMMQRAAVGGSGGGTTVEAGMVQIRAQVNLVVRIAR